jgi:hypothetical protein
VTLLEAMGGWSMSLTSFGVAKLGAAVTAMLKQYDGPVFEVATWCRITRLVRSCAETNYDSSRYSADDHYMVDIIARPLAIIGD